MAQVAYAHGGAELVHLSVAANVLHVLRTHNAEVLPLVQKLIEARILEADGAALNGVEHFGCVETEHGGVAERGNGRPCAFNAEGVGRVIDDFEAVPVGDLLNRVHVTEVSVHVHGYDGAGARGNEILDRRGVEGVIVGLDVGEHGRQALAHNGVGSGGEGERRGDDLALEPHGL